MVFLQL